MAQFKIDASGMKFKKVRWFTKRRKTKSRKWMTKWVPLGQTKPGTPATPPIPFPAGSGAVEAKKEA